MLSVLTLLFLPCRWTVLPLICLYTGRLGDVDDVIHGMRMAVGLDCSRNLISTAEALSDQKWAILHRLAHLIVLVGAETERGVFGKNAF